MLQLNSFKRIPEQLKKKNILGREPEETKSIEIHYWGESEEEQKNNVETILKHINKEKKKQKRLFIF